MYRLVLLSVTQAILMCSAQSLFKVAAVRMGTFSWTWAFFRDGILTNWVLLASGICALSGMLEWIYMLRHFPFSIVYPLSSLSFLFGMVIAVVFFHETVVWTQWVGVLLILAGCGLIVK